MRVLLWSELFWPYVGGPEILAARLIPALRDRGHEFLMVTSHDSLDLPDEARYEGIPIRRFPFRAATASRDLARLRALRSQVAVLKRAFAPDLVHVNGIGASPAAPSADSRCASIGLARDAPDGGPALPGGAHGYAAPSGSHVGRWVVACAEAVLAQVRAVAPEIAERSSVIRNGVELPPETPGPLPLCSPPTSPPSRRSRSSTSRSCRRPCAGSGRLIGTVGIVAWVRYYQTRFARHPLAAPGA